jgi:hypothetical protein
LRLTQVSGAGLHHLAGLVNLRDLDLQSTRVSDQGLEALQHLPLTRLALYDTEVSAAGLEKLTGATMLEVLLLGMTLVEDSGLRHVVQLPNLRALHLSGNEHVTDEGLRWLAQARSLRELNLWATLVSEGGVADLHEHLPAVHVNADL